MNQSSLVTWTLWAVLGLGQSLLACRRDSGPALQHDLASGAGGDVSAGHSGETDGVGAARGGVPDAGASASGGKPVANSGNGGAGLAIGGNGGEGHGAASGSGSSSGADGGNASTGYSGGGAGGAASGGAANDCSSATDGFSMAGFQAGGAGGGSGEPTPPLPGCLRSSYSIFGVRTNYGPGCTAVSSYTTYQQVSVSYDSSGAWRVSLPPYGSYPLRQTADGFEAGVPAPSPTMPLVGCSQPRVGFSATCANGENRFWGTWGDCKAGSALGMGGQAVDCSVWATFADAGVDSHHAGKTFVLQAYVTCRERASFEFVMHDPSGSTQVVQASSSKSSFTWQTEAPAVGDYTFDVRVTSEGVADQTATVPYYLVSES